jgi:hypothetical protein
VLWANERVGRPSLCALGLGGRGSASRQLWLRCGEGHLSVRDHLRQRSSALEVLRVASEHHAALLLQCPLNDLTVICRPRLGSRQQMPGAIDNRTSQAPRQSCRPRADSPVSRAALYGSYERTPVSANTTRATDEGWAPSTQISICQSPGGTSTTIESASLPISTPARPT